MSQPSETLSPERLNALLQPLLPGTLGMSISDAGPEGVVGHMTVRPDLCTTGNILHGGAIMAFADTLGAVATVMTLPADTRTTTLESKTNFIGSARVGSVVTGTTTAVHKGRTTQVWQTRITGPDGRLVALVTQTQMIVPLAPKPDRG